MKLYSTVMVKLAMKINEAQMNLAKLAHAPQIKDFDMLNELSFKQVFVETVL